MWKLLESPSQLKSFHLKYNDTPGIPRNKRFKSPAVSPLPQTLICIPGLETPLTNHRLYHLTHARVGRNTLKNFHARR